MIWKWLIAPLGAALLADPVAAQPAGALKDSDKVIAEAGAKGVPLPVDMTVNGNVSVEAILLPPNVTRGVFGRAVSDRYAAVQLVVSNRSRDAALVVHSVFLDYSNWLLSASSNRELPPCPSGVPARDAKLQVEKGRELPECANPPETWQAHSKQNQIASTEYRIPRGQLLDAQQWSARNLTIRGLEALGSVAAGYVFAFQERGIAKGIASYNGNFLPAARFLFPDSTIEQLNRISDLGYRVNKVVPKESAEIVVAFFPIDRFLTPGVKKLYQRSPAIFFVPHEAAFDPKTKTLLRSLMAEIGYSDADFQREMSEALKSGRSNSLTSLLDRLSLNRIRVVVGGVMSVDADSIPAAIESVSFDESDPALLWAEKGVKKGTIHGRYLAGGKVTILEAGKLNLTDLAVIQVGSSDEALRFQLTVNQAIPAGTKLTFRVDKKDKNQKPVEGLRYEYVVKDFVLTSPAVDRIERAGDTLTITGKRFFDTAENRLVVTLEPGSVSGVASVKVESPADRTPTQIRIDLASRALPPACWTPVVAVGTMEARGPSAFAQPPAPKTASAKVNGNRVVVTGEQFVNLSACGKALTFEIAEQAPGSAFKPVENLTRVSAKEASFDLPKLPAGGKFKVRVLVGGTEADTRNID